MNIGAPSAQHDIIADVLAYLEENFTKQISLRHVANSLGYSPAYLTETFRHHTGTPITAWIIKRRIRAAQQLMCDRGLPVADAYVAVGFNDRSYFAKQFLKYVGITPAQYRKTCPCPEGAP